MRFQILFCAVLLAIICGCYCQQTVTTASPAHFTHESRGPMNTTTKPGWSNDVYKDDPEEDDDDWYDNSYNNNRRGNNRERGNNRGRDDKYDMDNYGDDKYGNDKYGDDKYGDDDDYKPSQSRSTRRKRYPDEYGNMNLYFREPSKTGRSKKLKKMRFPVHRFKKGHFPRFPPLLSFSPWLPIFADRLTKQTIIFSPTGGVYIIPPIINFYGQLISVAQLISSGYASLVASGAPPPPAVNVAPLVQPGAVAGPGIPPLNPATGGFSGAVKTQLRASARPAYPRTVEEEGGYASRTSNPGYGY